MGELFPKEIKDGENWYIQILQQEFSPEEYKTLRMKSRFRVDVRYPAYNHHLTNMG